MFSKKATTLFAIHTLIASYSFSEIIREDFNNLDQWTISSWGNTEFQYTPDNVSIKDGILNLKLSGSIKPEIPLCGEVTYSPKKFLYGSFRASIKTTNIPGSVIGWFVYKDGVPGDGLLHEVDAELLTRTPKAFQMTLHHDAYSVDHKVYTLPFDPSLDFHEYRFDWYKDSVVYFIDQNRIGILNKLVPDDSTVIMLNHWSKNLANWGGAAPTTDTYMYIDYMEYRSLNEDLTTTFRKSFYLTSTIEAKVNYTDLEINSIEDYKFTIFNSKGEILKSEIHRAGFEKIDLTQYNTQNTFVKLEGLFSKTTKNISL